MRKQRDAMPSEEGLAFASLTKKLLAVPKQEIDKKRAEHEKQKKHKNEKRAK